MGVMGESTSEARSERRVATRELHMPQGTPHVGSFQREVADARCTAKGRGSWVNFPGMFFPGLVVQLGWGEGEVRDGGVCLLALSRLNFAT